MQQRIQFYLEWCNERETGIIKIVKAISCEDTKALTFMPFLITKIQGVFQISNIQTCPLAAKLITISIICFIVTIF